MISLEANIRTDKTKGQLNAIRNSGNVPAIIYGGKNENQKISISKKLLKTLIEKENFLSNIITLSVDGKSQNVLPREVKYDILSDEPNHVDFLRVVPGVKIKIEVPVNFINHENAMWSACFLIILSQMFDVQYFDIIIGLVFWILLSGLNNIKS